MMKDNSASPKIAKDTFLIQLNWAIWFISIVFAIFVVVRVFFNHTDVIDVNFLSIALPPSKIFMLVTGIMVCFTFLEYFISLRATRKQFFKGIVLSSIGVAIVITVFTFILQGLAYVLGEFTPLNLGQLGVFENEGILFIVQHIMMLIAYYSAGWIISIGFYRYGIGGLLFVLIGLAVISGVELLWEGNLSNTILNWLNVQVSSLNFFTALLLSIALISLSYLIVKRVTNRVPIKVS